MPMPMPVPMPVRPPAPGPRPEPPPAPRGEIAFSPASGRPTFRATDRDRRWRLAAPGTPHHWLTLVALLTNLAVLLLHVRRGDWRVDDGSLVQATSALAVANIGVAVVIRQQHVINGLLWLAGRVPRWVPLPLRRAASRTYQVGGIHVGAAVAGTAWFVAFLAAGVLTHARDPGGTSSATLVLAWGIVVLLLVMVGCALPVVRRRWHDLFELTHRWGGWSALAGFWGLTVVTVLEQRSGSVAGALASSWRVWVLALVTACVAAPWLRLRRVPVSIERPSPHVAIASFDYGVTPSIGTTITISRRPLGQWHAFATVRTPDREGYRLLVSRAGDWTGGFIDDVPSHVWVRGVPTGSLSKTEVLFERVVYLVTGSGVGPFLGQILAGRVPSRLVWSVRSPRETYGDALVEEVQRAQPDAVIWDTTTRGKPDLLQLAREAYDESGAEAVFIVSNETTTRQLVRALHLHGIPAVGPVFDS